MRTQGNDPNWKFSVVFTVLGAAVLLVACTNAAGLLLSRARTRRREIAVRLAIGAGRFSLVRLLLTESLVLALPGAALGIVLAWLSLDLIVANVPLFVPSNSPAAINTTVLVGTIAVLVPAVLIMGLLPAVRLSRVRVSGALATGTRLGSTPLSRRGGQALIAIEVKRGEDVLVLRDSDGFPRWAGWRKGGRRAPPQ